MAVTIKDVAERANVSIATVSRVLNGAVNLKPKTVAAVNAAVKELEYEPNMLARSFKSRKMIVIGIIVPDFASPFFAEVIKSIEREFSNDGIVLFVDTYDDPVIERRGIGYMKSRGADVILISSTGSNEDYLYQLGLNGLSIIFIDRAPKENGRFPVVLQNKRESSKKVLERFFELGHERIALVTGGEHLTSNIERQMGVKDFLRTHPSLNAKIKCYFGSFTEEFGYEVANKILTLENRPTAILAGSSIISAGIMLYCKENKIEIPEDVSLVSFGQIASAKLIEPRLSYVDDAHANISRMCISLIYESFNQKKLTPQVISFSTETNYYSSVGEAPKRGK